MVVVRRYTKLHMTSCVTFAQTVWFKRFDMSPRYCFFRLMDGVKSWGSDWVAKDPVFCLRLHHERMLCHNFDDSYWCLKLLRHATYLFQYTRSPSFQFLSPVVDIIHHYAKVRKKFINMHYDDYVCVHARQLLQCWVATYLFTYVILQTIMLTCN